MIRYHDHIINELITINLRCCRLTRKQNARSPSFEHKIYLTWRIVSVCRTQLNKHGIIGKTSSQILWLQFTINKPWRFPHVLSVQNKQCWLICKAFHYCRKPSLSRLVSSFPFIVAYSECFNGPIILT